MGKYKCDYIIIRNITYISKIKKPTSKDIINITLCII